MTLSLSRRATLWGERPAVIDTSEGRRYSYTDLDSLAERFARKLSGRGVESGDRIALLSRNRIEILALVFAARRLGCSLALVSPYRSKSAIATLIGRLDPTLVVHEEAEADRLRKVRATTNLGELSDTEGAGYEADGSTTDPWLLFQPPDGDDSTVYVYTATNAEWNCIAGTTVWELSGARVANLLTLSRPDGLLVGVLPALYAGGTVLLHRAFRPDPALSLIERYDATHVYGTPLEFDRLVDSNGFSMANFASVEAFYSSAPLPADRHDSYLVAGHPVGRSVGTPAIPHLSVFSPERGDVGEKAGCIGRPVPDCEVRLAEGRLEARGPLVAARTLEERFGGWVETGLRAKRDDEGDYWLVEN